MSDSMSDDLLDNAEMLPLSDGTLRAIERNLPGEIVDAPIVSRFETIGGHPIFIIGQRPRDWVHFLFHMDQSCDECNAIHTAMVHVMEKYVIAP